MKEFVKRITVSLILMMMFLNSSFLSIVSIAVDEIEKIIDETKISVLQNIVLEKYVNYDIEDSKGVLTQFNLKTGIEYLDGEEYAPLSSTGILLNVPKIADEFPESVEVVGKSTKATNGSDIAKDFRFIYNKETGELKFAAVNEKDDEGNIYAENLNGARDEYTIICYYSENCYNDSNLERDLELSGFVQANIENEIGTRKRAEVSENWEVKENISGLVSTNVKTTEIYNGYIESNNKNETLYETEYIENLEIDVSVEKLCDEVYIVTDNNFVNKDNELNDKDKLIYKSTKIDKNKVMDLLGDDGYLQILNLKGEILGELNNDTEVGENGVYELIYQEELNDILIKISKIEKIGTIVLQNTKNIKSSMTNLENNRIYTKNNIICLNNIEKVSEEIEENEEVIQNEVSEEIEQKEIYNSYNENVIDIKDAESKIDLSIDKSEWTNNIQNDVILTANLLTNDSRYKLFDNPVIEIKLPDEVEKVTLGQVSLLYENSLSIVNTELIEDSNIIRITLSGHQTEYSLDSVVSGPEILIPLSFIIKKEISSFNTNIIYRYINGGELSENKELNVNIKSVFEYLTERDQEQEEIEVEENIQGNVGINNKLDVEIVTKVGNEIIQENDIVYENESIVFDVKLINDTNEIINNPKVVYNIPEGLVLVNRNTYLSDIPVQDGEGYEKNPLYTELSEQSEVVVELESLEVGEIYEKSFRVLVDRISENDEEKIIENEFKTIIDGKEIDNKKIDFIAQKAELNINLYPFEKEYISHERNYFSYYLDIENLTNEDIEDVKVRVVLGKELDFESHVGRNDKTEYDENTGILELTFNEFLANSVETIKISAYANKFEDNKNEYDVKFYAYIYCEEDKKFRSDLEEVKVETPYISIVQTSEKEGLDLQAEEEIQYNFLVTNPSNIDTIIDISDNLPEGLIPMIADYECYEIKEDNSGFEKVIKTKDISAKHTIDGVVMSDFELRTYIPAKETLKINIKAKVDSIFNDVEIVNFATVTGDEIFARTSNAIKNKIISIKNVEDTEEPDDPEIPSDPNEPDIPDEPSNPENFGETYSISGFVWIDKNKDGKRIESEELLQGIKVKLFDVDSNRIVVDENNIPKILETDENGYYNFDYIKKGRYIVLFEFDTGLYSLTAYQKDLIGEEINSDVVMKDVAIDGNIYKVGVTNIIELNENYYNVDMGLVENAKFDLKLDKYVSKIIVDYNNKETVYEFNNSKLAKVEIPKKEISEAVVNIEYKIIVTNEGNISGYVESIIDYLPKEMTFIASNNLEWKKDTNNNLINDSLANKKLNPGESLEVTLLLSVKNVTKNLINEAEIGIANNVNQIEDIDSKCKNRNQNEDDYSKAEVIVTIKTGIVKNIFSIFIIIAILIIISYVIYFIRNKKIRIFNIIPIIIIGMFLTPIMSVITLAYDESYGPDFESVIYSDLKYHFTHGSVWEIVHSKGKFYCASPGYHLCSKPHKYLKQNVTWEYFEEDKHKIYLQLGGCTDYSLWDFSVTGNPPQNFTLTKNSSPNVNDAYYLNSNEIVIGPFSFSTSLSGSYISSWSVVDENGSNITGSSRICNSAGSSKSLSFNDTFYLAVPERVTSIKLSVSAKYKYKLTKKGVGITTYKIDTSDDSYCSHSDAQHLRTVEVRTKEVEGETNASTSWNVDIPKGRLKINKIDTDTSGGLSGAKFRITGLTSKNRNYSNEILMTSSSMTLNLLPGTYKVEEIGTPNGYVLKLQVKSGLVQEGMVTVGNTTELTFKNRMYGNLVVEKIDKDKLEEAKKSWKKEELHKLEDLVFSGAKFKIYYIVPSDKTAKKRYIYNFVNKTSVPSTFETTTSKSGGQIFSVDANTCQFRLDNIPTYYNYYIEEIELSDDMLQYYDVSSEPQMVKWSADMSVYAAGSQSQYHGRNMISNAYEDMWFGFTNKQLRVDIQGYVWEDISKSKLDARDNLYNEKNENVDKRIPKMPVYLKKDGKIIAVRYTYTEAEKNAGKGEVGEYFFPAKSTYNADGTGNQYTIVIEELSRYLIEFEYNGLKYQCVLPNLNKDNGSKVAEEDKVYHDEEYHRRTRFNNKYYNISNLTKKDNGNEGKTKTGVELKYSNGDNWNSELVQNTNYYSTSLEGDVNPTLSATMYADTETARDKTLTNYKYVIEWVTGRRVIRNINLGIYEREQPDLAIVTDLEDIDLTINGYSHKYEYKNRAQYVKNGVPDKIINKNYDALLDGFSVGVKNSSNHNYNMSYTREIYDSYIAYTKNDKNNSNRLRVFVRYKIVVKNESSNLLSKISLKNYADSRLVFSGSEYIDSEGNLKSLVWRGNAIQSGSVIKTTGEIPMYIKPTECITIYIRYELNTNTIADLSLLGTPGNQERELELNRNVTEIMTYSTFSKDENEYGGIDKDSAPDNINYDKINTYEDDTDAAPGLAFKRKSSKLISGLVFEDKAIVPEGSKEGTKSTDLFTDKVREGSKKYENGEKGVSGVDVQMKNKEGTSVIKLYNLDSNGNVVVTNAQTITDANGKYEFTGMVPGEYYLQYTYGYYNRIDSNGPNTVKRVQTKIGDVNVTTESHKSTIVDIGRFKTLIDNNIENNNGYNQIKADYDKNKNLGTPENSLWYWYQKNNNFAYSSAVDNKQMRQNINNKLKSINYDVKANYDKVNPEKDNPQGIQYIESYTGFMDFPIEDTKEQITDINYVEGSRVYQVKFGIIERPRQSVLIDKEINHVKIVLANGQTLIEGNPLVDEIDYVTYPNNGGTLTIEIDNEIIEGATLDVGYQMEITNKSERDYDTVDYYRYGTNRTNLVKLKIGSIVDYADEKLSLNTTSGEIKEYNNNLNSIEIDKWYLINQHLNEAKLVGVPISPNVYNKIKKRKNMLVKYYANKELAPTENIDLGELSAKKLLTDLYNSDQIFNNYVEILNVENRVGRFYGEIKEDVWVLDTPGNFDVYDEINTSEGDNNYYGRPGKRSARMQIIPPTGVETIIIYSAVVVICLVILAGGIIFIKKKVLD